MEMEFDAADAANDSSSNSDGWTIEPEAPSEVVIADFHDERNRIDTYWERLESLDVPTPDTTFFNFIENRDGGMPGWDTQGILEWMREQNRQNAFIRSAYKSAIYSEGQHISGDDEHIVDRTVAEMLGSHIMQQMPHGGTLVVREWLDLNFYHYGREDCHPEIRFFIDDGEVTAATPRLNAGHFPCENTYESARETSQRGIERMEPYAQTIAAEFTDNPWSIDFVMDTSGNWYCTEMGLNGVYYSSKKERWHNICGHGELDGEGVSPVEAFADELPDDPDESLKSELR